MQTKILVTYASKYGATAGLAGIAEVLSQAGLDTDIMPVKDVSTLNPYSAVVLGSALYVGRWRKAARKFLKRYEQKLAARDLWVFLSGPTGEEAPDDSAWHTPKKLAAGSSTLPHLTSKSSAASSSGNLSGLEKWMIQRVKAPTGDFRDWEAVSAWASKVAETIRKEQEQLT